MTNTQSKPVTLDTSREANHRRLNRLSDARDWLLDPSRPTVWLGRLAWRLPFIIDPDATRTETACTDGLAIYWSAQWIDDHNDTELIFVLAHEILHCACQHFARGDALRSAFGDKYSHQRFNVSADLAINPLLQKASIGAAPNGVLWPVTYSLEDFRAAEWYYAELPADPEDGPEPNKGSGSGSGGAGKCDGDEDGNGNGNGSDPGGCGSVTSPDDPTYADIRPDDKDGDEGGDGSDGNVAQDWDDATSAELSKATGRGRGSGDAETSSGGASLAEHVATLREDSKPLSWSNILERYVDEMNKAQDYSWYPPNRRYVSSGLYLPSISAPTVARLAVALDISGSMDDSIPAVAREMLALASASLSCVESILWIVHNHKVCMDQTRVWYPGDGDPFPEGLTASGGTSHIPVFDYIAESGYDPTALIGVTDMCSNFPDTAPHYPVLWVRFGWYSQVVPFGDTMDVTDAMPC